MKSKKDSGQICELVTPKKPRQDGAQSLHRAISIIKTVAQYEEMGVRMSKIANKVNLPTTTAHRILSVLVKEGLIEHNPHSNHYHIGTELLEIGLKSKKYNIREKYRNALERISKITEETSYLLVRSGNDAVCLDRVVGTYPIQVLTFEIGQRRPLGIGGGSLAILAALSKEEIETIISANSSHYRLFRGRTADDVRQMVKMAQKNGFGLSIKNVAEDTIGLGVPVFDQKGNILAAISIAGIERRMGVQKQKEIAKLIKLEIN